jgi:phenylalanyl-tRNA synthetase beta chain
MSREFEYARTTLRGSMLQTLEMNMRTSGGDFLALFEIARTYQPRENDLPHEVETVCGAIAGRKPGWWQNPNSTHAGFYDAKAHIDNLLAGLHLSADYRPAIDHAYLPGRTAEVWIGDSRVGLVGQVHPRVAGGFDIKQDIAMLEIDLEALLPQVPETVHYEPVSPYPLVEEDLAVIVDRDVPAADVIRLIAGSKLVRSVRVFDLYTGPPIPKGKKSLAFSVSYQSPDRTLSDEDVAKERVRIVERLKRELGADLRA